MSKRDGLAIHAVGFLYNVANHDVAVIIFLSTVAALAGFVPARRAMRVDRWSLCATNKHTTFYRLGDWNPTSLSPGKLIGERMLTLEGGFCSLTLRRSNALLILGVLNER